MKWTIFFLFSFVSSSIIAQSYEIVLEDEFMPNSAWQEYTPDIYNIGDSLIISVGLATIKEANETKQEIIIRGMDLDGHIKFEKFHFLFSSSNPDLLGYGLSTFYNGSTLFKEKIYVLTTASGTNCNPILNYTTGIFSFDLEGNFINEDNLCLDKSINFNGIALNPANDSTYIYGSIFDMLGESNPILISTASTFQEDIHIQVDNDLDSTIDEIQFNEENVSLIGTTYWSFNGDTRIWAGKFINQKIVFKDSFHYMLDPRHRKNKKISEEEYATFISDKLSGINLSSVLVFKDSVMQWNYFDAHRTVINDVTKINDQYLLLRTDVRSNDFFSNKFVFHKIDSEGYEINSEEFIVPWLRQHLNAIRINDYYYIFNATNNWDIQESYIDGEIDGTMDQLAPVHIFKFKIS